MNSKKILVMKCHKLLCMLALLLSCSCRTKEPTIAPYYTSETECIADNYDGTGTMRVWSRGMTAEDSREQAKRQAVMDAMFKGIYKGTTGGPVKPILTEVNVRERYKPYFDRFFQLGGAYSKYVKLSGNIKKSHVKKNDIRVSSSVVVTVNYSELRNRLIDDNILVVE